MEIQRVKDRSEIRECMVTKKQGARDEYETGEEKQGSSRRWVSVGVRERSREDPGEIHRSMGFGVQEYRRKYRKGIKEEGVLA